MQQGDYQNCRVVARDFCTCAGESPFEKSPVQEGLAIRNSRPGVVDVVVAVDVDPVVAVATEHQRPLCSPVILLCPRSFQTFTH